MSVAGLTRVRRAPAALALGLLWVYRRLLSPLKPRCCRFSPSCSEYARLAIARHGLLHGGWLAIRRLGRCHPFSRAPWFDPVPGTEPASRPPSERQAHHG
jgi:hypothetical protein